MASHRLNVSAVEDFCVLNGLSHAALARKAELSESYMSELLTDDESKRKAGSASVWKKIADALGVQVMSILLVEEKAAS